MPMLDYKLGGTLKLYYMYPLKTKAPICILVLPCQCHVSMSESTYVSLSTKHWPALTFCNIEVKTQYGTWANYI